jgi:tripartite-type tricarboxylate transporter receptor subunit TctC
MRRFITFLGTVAILAAACVSAGSALAAKGADYFNGKTLTWIVATGPGGGHDFYGRLIARHIKKAIPGLSTVVVNRPGAGFIIGTNLIWSAKPDGLTIGSFSTGLVYVQIRKLPGAKFDLTRMSWIGKAASDVRMLSVAKDSAYKTFEDIINSKRPVKFSAAGVGTGAFNDAFMLSDVYKIPYKIIVGYQGAQAALGMVRGETDALMGSMSSGMNYVRAGHTRVVMQFGDVLKGVPNANQYAKTPMQKTLTDLIVNFGKLARITAGPENIVPDRLAALRAGYMKAVTSKELLSEAKRAHREIDPAGGEDVRKRIVTMLNQPPEIKDLLSRLSKQKVPMVSHTGPVTQIKRGGRRVWIKYQGKEVKAAISGSRTKVTIGGKKTKRKNIKIGMICTFTYPRAGAEAKNVDCKG